MMVKSKYTQAQLDLVATYLSNPYWRLTNLYNIIDKTGHKVIFKPNWAQQRLLDDIWYCNIILKARQLGISTFICMLFLDKCLWNNNLSCGIIADTQDNGKKLFLKIKFAYDNLMPELKSRITAEQDTEQSLRFNNGSSIYVGTSLRSTTVQYLHISEFGKICAKYPEKAREVITGSLNTLAVGQYCFIESTAEGREGYFFDMCQEARAAQLEKKELSQLDFRFHFFPWYGQQDYRLGSCHSISDTHQQYFLKLRSLGIILDTEQKNFYVVKESKLKDDIKREYPSTPEESWEVSNQGTYYSNYITQARINNRIGNIPYDESLPVHTAWDLGYNDSTAIWFFQVFGKEIRLIDYVEGSGSLEGWLKIVKQKPYIYDMHLAPHDVMVHEYSSGLTRQATARKLGVQLIKVTKSDVIQGINKCASIMSQCWFDAKNCQVGIKALENYKKEWDEKIGDWKRAPLHNWASHGADAFRTLATGLHYITGRATDEEKARDELERAKDQSGLLPGHFLYMPETKDKFKDPLRNLGQRHSIF